MNVVLSPETQKLLEQRMTSAGFATPDDAIRAGLEMLNQEDRLDDFEPGELLALIEEGERSIRDEGTLDGEEAFKERQRRRQAIRSKSA